MLSLFLHVEDMTMRSIQTWEIFWNGSAKTNVERLVECETMVLKMLMAIERNILTVLRRIEIPKYSLTIMWRCQIFIYISRYLSNVKYTWVLVKAEKILERIPDFTSWWLVATISVSSCSKRSLITLTEMMNCISRKYFVIWMIPPITLMVLILF